jgi:hypothetical protein
VTDHSADDVRSEFIDPKRSRLATVPYRTAVEVIETNHYLHRQGAPSGVYLGLFVDEELAGVLTYGTLIKKNAAAICGPDWAGNAYELNRLWVADWAGRNSESWFIAQSFKWLKANRPERLILLSYADSAAGHVGTIYQATNWLYTGYSTKGGYVDGMGRKVPPRSASDARRGINASTDERPLEWKPCLPKHRYIRFLGNRTQRHQLEKAFRWTVQPYPKPEGWLVEEAAA